MLAVSLPARINIVGSPTDAVEGAYATISAAIDKRGGARIEAADGLEFRRSSGARATFPRGRIADPAGFDIEAAAVNGLLRYVPEFASRVQERGAAISTWTDIPASSGLAGSSVLLLAVLAALRAFYALDPRRCNDYVLAEIAQRVEEQEMGIVCGFADRYVPLFGDIAYLSYHGKLWHAPLGEEPFVTYERLGRSVPPLRFCVATTGVQRDSGSVHAPMRARYLDERRRRNGPLLELARQLGETAWRGKIALLAGDLEEFGTQIMRNQQLIDAMMCTCGFASGAGAEVRALITAAHDAGALGAKLTGAGGGGAIFALAAPGREEHLATALRAAAQRAGLTASEVFIASVSSLGLQVAGAAPRRVATAHQRPSAQNTYGVILAAGAGTRLGALGERYSKPTLPVAGQPLIDWVIARLRASGVKQLVVVGHPSDQQLRDHLHETHNNTQLIVQSERRGIADALRLALPLIADLSGYLACACDSLFEPDDINQLIATGRSNSNAAVVGVLEMGSTATASRSAVQLDGEQVTEIIEKPAPGTASSGIVALPVYWLPPGMSRFIEDVSPLGAERYISTALNAFIAAGGTVLPVRMRSRLEVTTAADVERVTAQLENTHREESRR